MAALRLRHLLGALLALGCSGSDEPKKPDDGPRRLTDDAAGERRAACEFGPGALAQETLGESDLVGDDIPIEHVLVLMMENRSFDHYFAKLPERGQPDAQVAPPDFENVDGSGAAVRPFRETRKCIEDPTHTWRDTHLQWNEGKLDGFALTNEPDGARALGYYDEPDLPFYYALANEFAIGDRYFCSLLGPTWPNRLYLYSGSSHGLTKNTIPTVHVPSVYSELADAGVEWRVYRSNLTPAAMFIETWLESTGGCGRDNGEPCRLAEIERLRDDLAEGTLPPVTFIDPEYSTGIHETSEHPPGNPQLGQRLVWEIVTALTTSPLWEKSALFITYDEHGGFFDHVPPPSACHPGTAEPEETGSGSFDRYGFRVPAIVVSPYAKKHHVSHVVHDHTSILRFIQARFGLRALSARDANAAAMMDFFDFAAKPHAVAPSFPEPPVDASGTAQCEADFPMGM